MINKLLGLFICLNCTTFMVASAPQVDSPKIQQEPKLSYTEFINQNLVYDSDVPLEYVRASDDQKVDHVLMIFNEYSGEKVNSVYDMPIIPTDFIEALYNEHDGLYPDLENMGQDDLGTIIADFPYLNLKEVVIYFDYIQIYYERMFEYDVLQNYALTYQRSSSTNANLTIFGYSACLAEIAFLAAHFTQAQAILDATEDTEQWVIEMYDATQWATDDIKANAVKHAMWNYRIAQKVGDLWLYSKKTGREIAKKFTDIHEECGSNPVESSEMDYHNNAVGRKLHEIHQSLSKSGLISNLWSYVSVAECVPWNVGDIQSVAAGRLVHLKNYTSSGATLCIFPVTACIEYTQDNGEAPAYVTLDGSCSYPEPGYSIDDYSWEISNLDTGNSFTRTGISHSFNLSDSGLYIITLTVSSNVPGEIDTTSTSLYLVATCVGFQNCPEE